MLTTQALAYPTTSADFPGSKAEQTGFGYTASVLTIIFEVQPFAAPDCAVVGLERIPTSTCTADNGRNTRILTRQ